MYRYAEALKENKPLRTLELGYNPIGPKGAEALAETVKFHSKLTALRMGRVGTFHSRHFAVVKTRFN